MHQRLNIVYANATAFLLMMVREANNIAKQQIRIHYPQRFHLRDDSCLGSNVDGAISGSLNKA